MELGSGIERIILVQRTAGGATTPVVVYKKKKYRSSSKGIGKFGRFIERLANAQVKATKEYADLHTASAEKKKDGWLKDMGRNVFKASKRARKAMRDTKDD